MKTKKKCHKYWLEDVTPNAIENYIQEKFDIDVNVSLNETNIKIKFYSNGRIMHIIDEIKEKFEITPLYFQRNIIYDFDTEETVKYKEAVFDGGDLTRTHHHCERKCKHLPEFGPL